MSHRPLVVGITGNIATGKSTVAGMLGDLGAEVIDADRVAHRVMQAGTPTWEAVVDAFGREIVGADGEIDRRRLGAIVFGDAAALARLEAIIHPLTIETVNRRIAAATGAVVVEAIKLIESGMADDCDSVWVTVCRPEQQVARIVAGRGLSRAEAEQRVQAQSSPQLKVARADVVIDTSGSLPQTRAQVEAAWACLDL